MENYPNIQHKYIKQFELFFTLECLRNISPRQKEQYLQALLDSKIVSPCTASQVESRYRSGAAAAPYCRRLDYNGFKSFVWIHMHTTNHQYLDYIFFPFLDLKDLLFN